MGLGDWFPTKGAAKGTIEVSGSVGSKGRGMRKFAARARRKRENRPENSKWYPYHWAYSTEGLAPALGGVPVLIQGTRQRLITLNPILDFEGQAALAGMSALPLNAPSSCKIKRFQGKIFVVRPILGEDESFTSLSNDSLLINWDWSKYISNDEDAVLASTTFDPLTTAVESYKHFQRRDTIAWGEKWIAGNWQGGEIGTITGPKMEILQQQRTIELPFPRLPKEGLRITRNQTLTMAISYRGLSTINLGSVPTMVADTSQPAFLLPAFRYLVSFDD